MNKALRELRTLRAIWLNQVFADPEIDASAFKVAYAMAWYMTVDKAPPGFKSTVEIYRDTGKIHIWPPQDELADKCHLNPQTVSRCIATLITRKHNRLIRRGNQFKGSNKYAVIVREKRT